MSICPKSDLRSIPHFDFGKYLPIVIKPCWILIGPSQVGKSFARFAPSNPYYGQLVANLGYCDV